MERSPYLLSRWVQIVFCLLLTDTTTVQPEHSHCPLVEQDLIAALFIVYRYDSTTGTFTVPPGGDGFYYFSVYLLVRADEYGNFDIRFNGEMICEAYAEQDDTIDDEATTSCNAIASLGEGKK